MLIRFEDAQSKLCLCQNIMLSQDHLQHFPDSSSKPQPASARALNDLLPQLREIPKNVKPAYMSNPEFYRAFTDFVHLNHLHICASFNPLWKIAKPLTTIASFSGSFFTVYVIVASWYIRSGRTSTRLRLSNGSVERSSMKANENGHEAVTRNI